LATATGTGAFINNGSGAVVWAGVQSKATLNTNVLNFTLGGTNTGNNDWQSGIDNNSASGLISITKTNAGKWILSGNNTYDGPTTVSEGTLLVNGNQSGATGTVSVASGATLGGTGTVGGAVSMAATATLEPGSAGVGTLTVTGAVTLAEGAVYKWECQNGVGDLVALTGPSGTLTLPSVATVQVSRIAGDMPSPATLFTAAALAGAADLSGWTVKGLAGGKAQIQGTSVILKSVVGTVVTIR
jgi:autotransporter-associated beta strand protein